MHTKCFQSLKVKVTEVKVIRFLVWAINMIVKVTEVKVIRFLVWAINMIRQSHRGKGN